MTVISNPLLLKKKAAAGGGDSGYQIPRCLRFEAGDSSFLKKPTVLGNRRTWTFSTWFKKTAELGENQVIFSQGISNDDVQIRYGGGSDTITVQGVIGGAADISEVTTRKFRDPSAWHHLVVTCDTNHDEPSDRLRIYINGTRLFPSGASSCSQYAQTGVNDGSPVRLACNRTEASFTSGYLADTYLLDGLAVSPSSFGSWDSLGVWNPRSFRRHSPNDGTNFTSTGTATGTWSNASGSGGVSQIFDGDTSTLAYASGGADTFATFTFDTPIKFSDLRLYVGEHGTADTQILINDVDLKGEFAWAVAGSWKTVTSKVAGNELKKIALKDKGGASSNFRAIEVDGRILKDSTTDITTRNNPNNGTKWSGGTAAGTIHGAWANLFDGAVAPAGPEASSGNSGAYAELTLPAPIEIKGELRLLSWIDNPGCKLELTIDGSTTDYANLFDAPPTASQWRTVRTTAGSLTKIKLTSYESGGSNHRARLVAMEVDGHIITDSTFDNSFHLKYNETASKETLGYNSFESDLSSADIKAANGAPMLKTDIVGVPTTGYRTDDDSADLLFAIPFIENTNDVRNSINNSLSNYTASGGGGTSQSTDGPFGYTGSRKFTDGSANMGITYAASGSELELGTGDYTVEFWFKPATASSDNSCFWTIEDDGYNNLAMWWKGDTGTGDYKKIRITQHSNGSNNAVDHDYGIATLTIDEWQHLAVCRKSNVLKFYLNGAETYSATDNCDIGAGSGTGNEIDRLLIGCNSAGGTGSHDNTANGLIADFRFYKKAKYDGTFDIPGTHNFTTVTNVVVDPNSDIYSQQNFNVAQWTGTGSGLTVTGVGFEPDIVWTKCKSHDVDHKLFSRILGTTKLYEVNQDRGIFTDANSLTAFNSDGFVLGTSGDVNTNTRTYSAWCFKCGGAASSNSEGSITSSVSANASGLYSVLSYTGTGSNATVGHGLGKKPAFIWVKEMNDVSSGSTASGDAKVYMSAHGAAGAATMHNDTAFADASGYWQSTDPTTDVFSIGDDAHVNTSGKTYQAICFGDVPGKIKSGSYTGNGNATGPSIELGFKPLFILVKGKSASRSWIMHDTINDTGANPVSNQFLADTSTKMEDNQYNQLDFNATGFQVKGAGDYVNNSGQTFYYLAIAADTPGDNDSFTDSPTNYDAGTEGKAGEVRGNFCTLNPLTQANNSGSQTFKQGNLYHESTSSAGAWHMFRGTMTIPKGSTDKFYYEVEWVQDTGDTDFQVGWVDPFQKGITASGFGDSPHEYCFRGDNGKKFNNNTQTNYGSAPSQGDVVGVGYDNKAIRFWVNGTEQDSGTAAWTGVEKHLMPGFATYTQSNAVFKANFNFGQRPFKHPQSGYKALCTQNLPDIFSGDDSTVINNPSKYFDVKLFTGDDTTDGSKKIKYNFSPDLYWQKSRSNAYHNRVFDRIRGQGSLVTNGNISPNTDANSTLTTFDSDGVSIENTNDELGNSDGVTYVGWAWDAGTAEIAYAKYLTGGIDSNYPARNAFDGLLTSGSGVGCRTTQGGTMTFEPPTDIAFTKLRIYANNDNSNGNVNNNTWKVNGTDVTSAINSGAQTSYAWIDVTSSVSSPLDKIEIKSNSSGGTNPRIQAIEINDVILTANGDGVDGITEVRWTNTSSGFSICKYTGTGAVAKIGHGLPDPPEFVLIKALTHTSNWAVYHSSVPNTHAQKFNMNVAAFDNADYWNDNTPSDEVVHIGSNYDLNQSNAHQYIMYAWSPVPGYSSFGSFTGNGDADGPFVYTGFKPRWILTKNTETTRQWVIWDTRRSPGNFADECLFPDTADDEDTKGPDSGTDNDIDILSNGFKIRNIDSAQNESTKKILYAAFAEHPFKLSRAR